MALARTKILYVTPGLRQGGAERQLLELMRRLPDRFEPVLCVFEADEVHYGEYLLPGQPRHVLGASVMTWSGLRKLAKIIAEERPGIVHAYRDHANFWTRMAMQLFGTSGPVVITSVRNRALEPLNLLTESVFADFTYRVLSNSRGVDRELRVWARVPEGKLQVIPNFVELDLFRPALPEQRQAARRRFDLGPEDRVLAQPGRVSLQKHQIGLLLALRSLKAAGRLGGKPRLLFAGRDSDRIYAWAVRRLIDRWGLADTVRVLGPVPDVLALYHAADAVVMPSLYEGMPNAVIEAQACGLPVVVSRAANADGLVVHGETGFEVKTADHRELVDALASILTAPEADLREMGRRGRRRMAEVLDNEVLLEMFTSLYDRALAAR